MLHALSCVFVQHVVAKLRGPWILGRAEPPLLDSTELDRWRISTMAAFSDEYRVVLRDKESIALQYTLDLALFDSVKVKLLASGAKAAIEELCVFFFFSMIMAGGDFFST